MTMTRKEYFELSRTDSLAAFHQYYGQFVTPYVLEVVREHIGEDRIKASKDTHFNDIPLKLWDRLVPFVWHGVASKNEELNGTRAVSVCECVCTLKTAAHNIRND